MSGAHISCNPAAAASIVIDDGYVPRPRGTTNTDIEEGEGVRIAYDRIACLNAEQLDIDLDATGLGREYAAREGRNCPVRPIERTQHQEERATHWRKQPCAALNGQTHRLPPPRRNGAERYCISC